MVSNRKAWVIFLFALPFSYTGLIQWRAREHSVTLRAQSKIPSVYPKAINFATYSNFVQSQNDTLLLPNQCYTGCCSKRAVEVLANSAHPHQNIDPPAKKICREGWGFPNGAILMRFSAESEANCTQVIRSGPSSDACRSPVQTHDQRVGQCGRTGDCTSTASRCLLHMCALFASEEFKLATNGYKEEVSVEFVNRALETLSQLSHLKAFFSLLPVFRGRSTEEVLLNAVNKSTENLAGQNLPNTQIYTLAMLTCSAASISAIPLGVDMHSMKTSLTEAHSGVKLEINQRGSDSRQLIAVTYSNQQNDGLDILIESAMLHDIPLHILGWGEKYPQPAQKLRATLEFLGSIHRDVIVLFLDAFDAIIVRDSSEILKRFDARNSTMVFGAENACYPMMYPYFNLGYEFCDDRAYFPSTSSVNDGFPQYLNSGQWIGEAGHALDVLDAFFKLVGEDLAEVFPGTDQFAMELLHRTGAWDITLDHLGEIFQVGLSYSDESIALGDTTVWHFNGQKPRARMWGKHHLHMLCAAQQTMSAIVSPEVYVHMA